MTRSETSLLPRIVVSRCLGFAATRYNGIMLHDPWVERLKKISECIDLCPEVEIGLGIPRDPIRIVLRQERRYLLQPSTGRDVTAEMEDYCQAASTKLVDIDGFILKGKSPSCGLYDTKFYQNDNPNVAGRNGGFFGQRILEDFPGLPAEDEGRLQNFRIREHFFTRIFANARLRELQQHPTPDKLIKFHSYNKLLMMEYNQSKMRELGKLVAQAGTIPIDELVKTYVEGFRSAIAKLPGRTSVINVLMHAAGYFKNKISAPEKALILDTYDDYREGKVPLSVPMTLIRQLAVRFDETYLLDQTFFNPFPDDLIAISESGQGIKR